MVWWSRAASETEARGQLERMVAKINRGSYPYGGYRLLDRQGVAVHAFQARGDLHYTYRQADQLYWISAPPALIDAVFEAVMK